MRARWSLRAGPSWPCIAATLVGQQLHRVRHRLDAAAAEVEVAGVARPSACRACCCSLSANGPVGVVVVGRRPLAGAAKTSAAAAAARRGRSIGVVLVWVFLGSEPERSRTTDLRAQGHQGWSRATPRWSRASTLGEPTRERRWALRFWTCPIHRSTPTSPPRRTSRSASRPSAAARRSSSTATRTTCR